MTDSIIQAHAAGINQNFGQLNLNIAALTEALLTQFPLRAHTGTFTCGAAASTVVADANVTAACTVLLTPLNAAAGTLLGSAKCLYISARTAGTSFTATTASGASAAGSESFQYLLLY